MSATGLYAADEARSLLESRLRRLDGYALTDLDMVAEASRTLAFLAS